MEAPTSEETDWPQIAALYEHLLGMTGSPVVALNHAVAVAEADGPQAGLDRTAGLDESLREYVWLHTTRAELLRRLGRRSEARESYLRAREIAQNDNVRLGQVNVQPLSPDSLGNGIVDRKFTIKPVATDKGWSKQNIGNFLYMLESNSQQVRVTRVKLTPPSSSRKNKPHEIGADLWTYDIEITSRQRE